MAILEVNNLQKIYTTRFGRKSGTGITQCIIFRRAGRICGDHGGVRFRKDNAANILARLISRQTDRYC